MRLKTKFSIFFIFLVLTNLIFAEGTKQLAPTSNSKGKLHFYYPAPFGLYDAGEDYRINITIKEVGETIYFGLGQLTDASNNYLGYSKFRIKDPNGNIIYSEANWPTTGNQGYINNYTEAVSGPNILNASGYDAISLTTTIIGDYVFEVKPGISGVSRAELLLFDFTVVDSQNNIQDGRLWSKSWGLTTSGSYGYTLPNGTPYVFNNDFDGKMFVYTNDSVVTSVQFQGMKPYGFDISCNSKGCGNTGNLINDRKSRTGNYGYPEYKIFLNNPDIDLFPSKTVSDFTAEAKITGCPQSGGYKITISSSSAGKANILLDVNGNNTYDIGDDILWENIKLTTNDTILNWNGITPNGNTVFFDPEGTTKLFVTYLLGMTHLPLRDIETNPNGFKVRLVRPIFNPADSIPALYWDDSNVGGQDMSSIGCQNNNGCHSWDSTGLNAGTPISIGQDNTINTWWFAGGTIESTIDFTSFLVTTSSDTCSSGFGKASIKIVNGTSPFDFSINGESLTVSLGDSFPILNLITDTDYIIHLTDNDNCATNYTFQVENKIIDIYPNVIETDSSLCGINGKIILTTTGGTAPYVYSWSNSESETGSGDSILSNLKNGDYNIIVTDYYGCTAIINETIYDNECEFELKYNILTPDNGDDINQKFTWNPKTIKDFEFKVFNRWGNIVFELDENSPELVFEGKTNNGNQLVAGTYYYYLSVEDISGIRTEPQKGYLTILR